MDTRLPFPMNRGRSRRPMTAGLTLVQRISYSWQNYLCALKITVQQKQIVVYAGDPKSGFSIYYHDRGESGCEVEVKTVGGEEEHTEKETNTLPFYILAATDMKYILHRGTCKFDVFFLRTSDIADTDPNVHIKQRFLWRLRQWDFHFPICAYVKCAIFHCGSSAADILMALQTMNEKKLDDLKICSHHEGILFHDVLYTEQYEQCDNVYVAWISTSEANRLAVCPQNTVANMDEILVRNIVRLTKRFLEYVVWIEDPTNPKKKIKKPSHMIKARLTINLQTPIDPESMKKDFYGLGYRIYEESGLGGQAYCIRLDKKENEPLHGVRIALSENCIKWYRGLNFMDKVI